MKVDRFKSKVFITLGSDELFYNVTPDYVTIIVDRDMLEKIVVSINEVFSEIKEEERRVRNG